jgi:hypothetical protein
MRKFAVTAFAILYGVLILSASSERSNDWVARQVSALSHCVSGLHPIAFTQIDKSDTHLPQKKRVERAFVVESPREIEIQVSSARYTLLRSSEYRIRSTSRTLSPRAPPVFV